MQIIVPSYHNATTDSTISTIVVVTNALFRNCFINNPFLPMIFPFQKNKKYSFPQMHVFQCIAFTFTVLLPSMSKTICFNVSLSAVSKKSLGFVIHNIPLNENCFPQHPEAGHRSNNQSDSQTVL